MKFYWPWGKKKEGKRRWPWSIVLAIIISGLTIWLSFRGIKLSQIKEAFRGVKYFWIILAIGNSLFTVYALGWRWRQFLNQRSNLSLGALFRLNILSQYANILAPARLGELLRMYLASRESRAEPGFVLGTIAAERILDALVFIMGWLFLSSYFALPESISFPLSLLIAVLGMTILVIFFILKPDSFMTGLRQALFFLPAKWKRSVLDFVRSGLEAFAYFQDLKKTAYVFILTLFLLLSQALTNYFVILAFSLKLSFVVAIMIILAIQVGSLPPSAPGKIGVFEYAVILALRLFSVPREQALCYAIMLHLVAYLPKIILGGFYLSSLPTNLSFNAKKIN